MSDPLVMNIKGIKCDHCPYVDMEVKVEDYPQWLNRPCPKCGCNLLTQEDMDTVNALLQIAKQMNQFLPPLEEGEKVVKGSIEFNGTGEVDIKIPIMDKVRDAAYNMDVELTEVEMIMVIAELSDDPDDDEIRERIFEVKPEDEQ